MDNNQIIKLLVVDDHPLVRKGIILCLAHRKNMEVVGELGDAREAVARAHDLQPDVVLMDVVMPHMSGLTAARRLLQELPRVKVLILSMSRNLEDLREALEAGARGYALKGTPAEELGRAVESVAQGHVYFSPELMDLTLAQRPQANTQADRPKLTGREREVLILIAEGRSNKAAAAELGVSVRTVEMHRESLMRKLDIHSAVGLARFAGANGYVSAQADPQPAVPA